MAEQLLGIIPARAGSRRLVNKNTRLLAGKPLVQWTIETALAADCLDRCILSSDDEAALDLARRYPRLMVMRRPKHLADEKTRNVNVMRHILAAMDDIPHYVVLLQPTSPFRAVADIEGTVQACREAGALSGVSVERIDKSSYWLFRENEAHRLAPIFRPPHGTDIRGSGPAVFVPNGAVFVIQTQWLMQGNDFYSAPPAFYEMPKERSVDVDDAFDLTVAEAVFALQQEAGAS